MAQEKPKRTPRVWLAAQACVLLERVSTTMDTETKDELPRAPRFEIRIPLKYRPSGATDWREGRTENISRSGVLFRTDHLMPLQTPIEFLMALPDPIADGATVICRGFVVRTEPPNPDDPRPAVAATIAGYRLTHPQSVDPVSTDPRRI
jgi:hypothetical protein